MLACVVSGVDVCLILGMHEAQLSRTCKTAAAFVHSVSTAPLHQVEMLPSRFGLPPSQRTLCKHQEVSDGYVIVLISYVKADIMTSKGSGHEKLHRGHTHLAVPKI